MQPSEKKVIFIIIIMIIFILLVCVYFVLDELPFPLCLVFDGLVVHDRFVGHDRLFGLRHLQLLVIPAMINKQ